jgi:hypothetical protein
MPHVNHLPLKASFLKYNLNITADGGTRLIHPVLMGELWRLGGQSNIAFPMRMMLDVEGIMTAASRDDIRIFYQKTVAPAWHQVVPRATPMDDTVKGRWLPTTSETNMAGCSGVAYTFVLALYDDLNQHKDSLRSWTRNCAEILE